MTIIIYWSIMKLDNATVLIIDAGLRRQPETTVFDVSPQARD